MITYHNDNVVKFSYIVEDELSYIREKNIVGATIDTTLRTLPYTPGNDNCVFVSKSTGDDATGLGTLEAPYATIAKGKTAVTTLRPRVILLDSETYTESFSMDGNFKELSAALGKMPVLSHTIGSQYLEQYKVVEPKTIDALETREIKVITLSNNRWLCCYRTTANSLRFCIYTDEGVVVKSPTTIDASRVQCCTAALLKNGNWVVVWGYYDDEIVKFAIYNDAGDQVIAPTLIENIVSTSYIRSVDVVCLKNGNWIVAWGQTYFAIYTDAGVQLLAKTQIDAGTGLGSVEEVKLLELRNSNWICVYGYTSNNVSRFAIYDMTGTLVQGPTELWASRIKYIRLGLRPDGSWIFCTSFSGATNTLLVLTYSEAGVRVTDPVWPFTGKNYSFTGWGMGILYNGSWAISAQNGYTIFNGTTSLFDPTRIESIGTNIYSSMVSLANNNLVCCYSLYSSGSYTLKFVIYRPFTSAGIVVSNDATMNGITIDETGKENIHRVIQIGNPTKTAKLTLRWCTFKNVVNGQDQMYNASFIYGDGSLDIENSIFANAEGGITLWGSIVRLFRCLAYRSSAEPFLRITGGTSAIDIEHVTFFDNYGGVELLKNNGTEIIKDCIFHDNANYAVKADVLVTIVTSCSTDAVVNATLDASCVRLNPRFIDEGYAIEELTNLHLQAKDLGYASQSPAIGIGSHRTDAGAYDVEYVYIPPVYYHAIVSKPEIEIEYKPVGDVKLIMDNGSLYTWKKGQTQYVKLVWKAIVNEDFEEVLKLWLRGGEVLVYFDPVTLPDTFYIMTVIPNDLKASPEHVKLSKTGTQDAELLLGRCYEVEA